MRTYLKKYPYLIVLPLIAALAAWFLFKNEPEEEVDPMIFATSSSQETKQSSQEWYVDVKGAVKQGGMYRITQGMRLMDAIELAGGFTTEADQNQINFSKLLADQEIIYVPKIGEELPTIHETDSNKTTASETEKININTADVNELQQLSGIGEKRAADIVKYREENGSFRAVEDLTKVSGIGEKTLENLKDSITI
ncbi:helix-hairpin-helix domain-containing protein [Enterococcus xiangfangensis]|uniref:Helix-hairpin-helix domain-containing protein n=1 Tax=Enterococcus xiangfangensis TaxID=1296537 RepID=A0ABU3FC19_9ENTE|nr:helix-hairpin-helix domain-containing protein [Enterococcus xiangfangensis]MDT2760216.1 helix-hairpin-helix domain-containing protein [Enterococcus xiangfangensis]NBK07558.1 comEA protein [Enterococcus asini]